jgi:hypothetical protein
LVDVLALLADHHTRPRRVDGDVRVLRRPIDLNPADGGGGELLFQEVPHLDIVVQKSA